LVFDILSLTQNSCFYPALLKLGVHSDWQQKAAIIDQLFNIHPDKYDQNESASDVLLDFVDKYKGPLI
jgi:hypothetical protein